MRKVESIADQLFFTTVYISADSPAGQMTGTGFIVNLESKNGMLPIVVSNKHVFGEFTDLTFRMVGSEGDMPSSTATQISVSNVVPGKTWVGHPSEAVDIAAMPFGEVIDAMRKNGRAPFFRGFTLDDFLTPGTSQNLDGIEQVLFVGYPNGLFDTASWLPIIRRGQTATPLYNDYRGQPSFLIDASVFPGSSGSPVVIYDRGMYFSRDGSTVIGSRFILVGILAAGHTRHVTGGIVFTQQTPKAYFEDIIDLGIVYKASAIREVIEALLDAYQIDLSQ